MTSTVELAVNLLDSGSTDRGPVVLLGFDASRHTRRHSFSGCVPDVLDMPICEETMLGTSLGLAAAGRTVVADLMFEGFLTRCIEPLAVGLVTAAAYTTHSMGRIVVRALGAPIAFGGPSHSAAVNSFLNGFDGITVVHVVDEDDVRWALSSSRPQAAIVVLLDLPDPAPMARPFHRVDISGMPLRLLVQGTSELAVCTYDLVRTIPQDCDVLAIPHRVLDANGEVGGLLGKYASVVTRGVNIIGGVG